MDIPDEPVLDSESELEKIGKFIDHIKASIRSAPGQIPQAIPAELLAPGELPTADPDDRPRKRGRPPKNPTIEGVLDRRKGKVQKRAVKEVDDNDLPKQEMPKDIHGLASTPKWKVSKSTPGRHSAKNVIESLWPQILSASRNGYTLQEIAAVLSINRLTLNNYLNRFPSKRAELFSAKYELRDEMLEVIINAAKRGNWLPAAWTLERLFPATFARPEVKLQMYDRMVNKDIVEQKIGGKSLDEVRKELEEQYKGLPDARRFFHNTTGSGSGGDGSNQPLQQPEDGDVQ